MADITKSPRIHVAPDLFEGISIALSDGPLHYLRNVMRVAPGAAVRVFNGRHGEFIARMERLDKRHAELTIENRIREQPAPGRRLHLLVPPLRKERFDFVVEKAAELGVTDLHPILTYNSDIRKINEARIEAQLVEAAEQCERLDIPRLHALLPLEECLGRWDDGVPVYAAIERMGTQPLPRGVERDCALLVGPAGGFTTAEKSDLAGHACVTPVTLGHNILRSETAAIAGLAVLTL